MQPSGVGPGQTLAVAGVSPGPALPIWWLICSGACSGTSSSSSAPCPGAPVMAWPPLPAVAQVPSAQSMGSGWGGHPRSQCPLAGGKGLSQPAVGISLELAG